MMGFSASLQNPLIDALFRSGTMPPVTTNLYIALLVVAAVNTDTGTTIAPGGGGTGQEPSAVDYARLNYGVGPTHWTNTQNSGSGASSGSSGTTMNVSAATFPVALNDWGTIVAVALVDALSGGNILFFGDLTTPISILTGNQFIFDVNTLQVILECP